MESSINTGGMPLENHLDILRKRFGHTAFRPMQWKIIHSVMEGKKDNCVIMATGYGKSLCYQYPSVFKNGLSIIISPLISLMEDQVQALEVANIPACYLGSAQTKTGDVIGKLMQGFYRLVYLTPEYASGDSGLDLLSKLYKTVDITLLAIDEAHCVSQWGHDFRPAYKNLGKLRTVLPSVPILAVTATATDDVKNDIIKMLALRSPQILSSGFDRPNLYFKAVKKSGDPFSDISKVLLHERKIFNIANGSVIIYCLTKKNTEAIAEVLNSNNVKCHAYHAGLSINTRKFVHEQFVKDEIKVLVATIAFGMGIDKPNVRCVIHYGAASEMEGYYQEAGRAGRDGNPSLCILYHSTSDFATHENLREFGNMSSNIKTHKSTLNMYMKDYISSRDCRRHSILSYFDKDICPPASPSRNCCDNCTRMANTPKDSIRYEGIDENGLYDFSKDAELFLKAIECFHPKSFGAGMIIALLRGSKAKKLDSSYFTNSLHGAGLSKSEIWWKQIAFLLEKINFIKKDRRNFGDKNFSVIMIDRKGEIWLRLQKKEKADPILLAPTEDIVLCLKPKSIQPQFKDDNEKVDLQQFARESSSSSSKPNDSSRMVLQLNDFEEKLANELIKVRHILAKTSNIMPYVVASDIALQQMAVKRPLTLVQLVNGKFDGMSDSKISKFGNSFIRQIKEYCIANPQPVQSIYELLTHHPLPLSSTGQLSSYNVSQRKSVDLFNEGKTLQEVAAIRKLETSTIINHFACAMRAGCKFDLRSLITAPKLQCIIDIIQSAPINKDMSKLAPIKNICPPVIKYDDIKLTIAYLEVRNHLNDLNCPYKDHNAVGDNNGTKVFHSLVVNAFETPTDEAVADANLLIYDEIQNSNKVCEESNEKITHQINVNNLSAVCIDDGWEADDIFAENIDELDKVMNQSIDSLPKSEKESDVCSGFEEEFSLENLDEIIPSLEKINTDKQASEKLSQHEEERNVLKRKLPDWLADTANAKQIMKKKLAKNSLFN